MSFRGEFKDFVEGFKFGQDVWSKAADTRYREFEAERIRPAPYDPGGTGPLDTPGGGKVGETPAKVDPAKTASTGSDVAMPNAGGASISQQAYNYFRLRGLSDAAAGGIAGNIGQETGDDPRVVGGHRAGDAGQSFFAAQWNGPRLANLYKFAGTKQPTLKQQFDFILEEMNPDSPYADQQAAANGAAILGAKSREEATELFRKYFERPSADDLASRIKWANRVKDTGEYGTPSPFSFGAGVVAPAPRPAGESDTTDGGDVSDSGDGGGQQARSGSPPAGVDVAQVDIPNIQFQPIPLPQLPGSTMFAAQGGVIPEPKRYALGGFEEGIENIAGTANAGNATTGFSEQAATNAAKQGQMMFANMPNTLAESKRASASGMQGFGSPGLWGMRTPPVSNPAWGYALGAGRGAIPEGGLALPGGQVVQPPATTTATTGATGTTAQTDTGTHPIGTPVELPKEPEHVTLPKVKEPVKKKKVAKKKVIAPKSPPPPPPPAAPKQKYTVQLPYDYTSNLALKSHGYNPSHPFATGGGRNKQVVFSDFSELTPDQQRFLRQGNNMRMVVPYTDTSQIPGYKPHMEEGGVIPEGPLRYAEGGRVSAKQFAEEVRREGRFKHGKAGEEENPRDIVARRHNIRERGVWSTAYDPTQDRELWQPRKARPKAGGGGKGGKTASVAKEPPVPTPRPEPSGMTTEERQAERMEPRVTPAPVLPEAGGARPEGAVPFVSRVEGRPEGAIPFASRIEGRPEGAVPFVSRVEGKPETVSDNVRRFRRLHPPMEPDRPPERVAEPESFTDEVLKTVLPEGKAQAVPPTIIGESSDVPASLKGNSPDVYIRLAMQQLQAGGDPKQIGDQLEQQGISRDYWPVELQNRYLGFAEGGVIPESIPRYAAGGAARSAGGYGEDPQDELAPPAQQQEPEQLSPTPQLRGMVQRALDGGLKFLQNIFGMNRQGAIAAPDDRATARQGAMRMASGEGAATSDEIRQVDDQVDPQRKLDEGDRQMTRLARVVDWYLQRGRGKEAEAAAASLMMYGANRFGQLGQLSGAAYDEYLKSGDPSDLNEAVKYLEHAYSFVPDGSSFDVTIDPQTHRLQGVKIDADGNEQPYDLSARELPQLIQQVQSKSPYWQIVSQLASGAGGGRGGVSQEEKWRHAEQVRDEQRAYEAGVKESTYKRTRADKLADEKTRRANQLADQEARTKAAEAGRLQQDELLRKRQEEQQAGKKVDWTKVNPLRQAAEEALAGDDQDATDAAVSKLFDALPPDVNREQYLTNMGISPDDWSYKATPERPAGFPEDATYENGKWVVTKDGKRYEVRPKAAATAGP